MDDTNTQIEQPVSRSAGRSAFLFLLVMPLAMTALFLLLGQGASRDQATASGAGQLESIIPPESSGEQPKLESVAVLTDRLAARLEREPHSADDWMLLARSYEYLNEADKAREARARATRENGS